MQKLNEAKIRRIICRHGQPVTFTRQKLNEFGEAAGDPETVHTTRGLYHDTAVQIDLNHDDAGARQTVRTPRVIIPYSGADFPVRQGDRVAVGDIVGTVYGWHTIGNTGQFIDVNIGGEPND